MRKQTAPGTPAREGWIADALAGACPGGIRPGGPADAVAGLRPGFVATPASTAQAAAVLRAATGLGLAVVPRGTGTRLDWGCPPRRCDLVVDTTLLNRVIEHAAGDLVVTVQAGVTLAGLAGVLGAAGQRLALDPPGGTIGGVLATGAAGPLRLRFGAPRDLVIGMTVVRADGVVARSGGKVVKNVAGYDLARLFAGSYGTLGLIAEATFRLHPVPAATAFLTAGYAKAADACRALRAALTAPLDLAAAELDWPAPGAPVTVGFRLEGDAASVSERADGLAALLAGAASAGALPGADRRPAAAPPAWWGAIPGADPGGTLIQVAFWTGDLPRVLATVAAASAAAGLDPAVRGAAAAGVLQLGLPGAADPGAVASLVAALRAALARDADAAGEAASGQRSAAIPGGPPRGSAAVLAAPPAVRALADSWGPVGSARLMRAVKDQFDPGHLLSPGRFAGGI